MLIQDRYSYKECFNIQTSMFLWYCVPVSTSDSGLYNLGIVY